MRRKNRLLAVLALSFAVTMSGKTAQAKEYTYTITLHAGDQGAINGEEGGAEILTGCRVGDRVSFDLSQVTVTDEKYYIKGVRPSGRDNEEVAPAFYVEGDADYVVAYGIKGNLVGYTVHYQDEEGTSLAESETFYGNVGDKPVVAYQYIEGYVPQALAMTKTLAENEAENVFTFVYEKAASEVTVNETVGSTTIVSVTENRVAAGNATGGAVGGTGTDGTESGETDREAAEEEETARVTEPEELVDLDEIETPAGNVQLEDEAPEAASGIPMAAAGAVGVGALAALAGLAVIVRRRMRSK